MTSDDCLAHAYNMALAEKREAIEEFGVGSKQHTLASHHVSAIGMVRDLLETGELAYYEHLNMDVMRAVMCAAPSWVSTVTASPCGGVHPPEFCLCCSCSDAPAACVQCFGAVTA